MCRRDTPSCAGNEEKSEEEGGEVKLEEGRRKPSIQEIRERSTKVSQPSIPLPSITCTSGMIPSHISTPCGHTYGQP
jgi:hypothetical protein